VVAVRLRRFASEFRDVQLGRYILVFNAAKNLTGRFGQFFGQVPDNLAPSRKAL
jgi:hypothetical protein